MNKNVVLIGMSGCGKTTIGKLLAEKLSCNFIDVDEYIENKEGLKISEIFKSGECYFRKLEEKYISEISISKNTVVSTGGGVVLNVNNINKLKNNSFIVYIYRDLVNITNTLDTSNRPLLNNDANSVYDLFKRREQLYEKYCDFKIYNNKNIFEAVENIIKLIKNYN